MLVVLIVCQLYCLVLFVLFVLRVRVFVFVVILGRRVGCALVPGTSAFDLPTLTISPSICLVFLCFQSDHIICTSKYLSG